VVVFFLGCDLQFSHLLGLSFTAPLTGYTLCDATS